MSESGEGQGGAGPGATAEPQGLSFPLQGRHSQSWQCLPIWTASSRSWREAAPTESSLAHDNLPYCAQTWLPKILQNHRLHCRPDVHLQLPPALPCKIKAPKYQSPASAKQSAVSSLPKSDLFPAASQNTWPPCRPTQTSLLCSLSPGSTCLPPATWACPTQGLAHLFHHRC